MGLQLAVVVAAARQLTHLANPNQLEVFPVVVVELHSTHMVISDQLVVVALAPSRLRLSETV